MAPFRFAHLPIYSFEYRWSSITRGCCTVLLNAVVKGAHVNISSSSPYHWHYYTLCMSFAHQHQTWFRQSWQFVVKCNIGRENRRAWKVVFLKLLWALSMETVTLIQRIWAFKFMKIHRLLSFCVSTNFNGVDWSPLWIPFPCFPPWLLIKLLQKCVR